MNSSWFVPIRPNPGPVQTGFAFRAGRRDTVGMTSTPHVELAGLTKSYQAGVPAVASVDLVLAPGELLAVVGPSGSGKSTLLRLIAGLETADSGQLRIDGQLANAWVPSRRDAAIIFQNPALYPH